MGTGWGRGEGERMEYDTVGIRAPEARPRRGAGWVRKEGVCQGLGNRGCGRMSL